MNDLDIAFKLSDQLYTFWQHYIIITASIVGWVFSRKEAWELNKRIAVMITAVVFFTFNIYGLSGVIINLDQIIVELAKIDKAIINSAKISEAVFKIALDRLEPQSVFINIGLHVLVDAIIIFYILHLAGKPPSMHVK